MIKKLIGLIMCLAGVVFAGTRIETEYIVFSNKIAVNGGMVMTVTNVSGGIFGDGAGGFEIDGPTTFDKNLLFADGGKKTFAFMIYRNEAGKYLYLTDYEASKDLMVVSRSGRVGINKMNNLLNYHTLTDQPDKSSDMEIDDTITEYTQNYQLIYLMTVDGTNSVADTYKIETAGDNNSSYTTLSTGNVMSVDSVNIGNGIWIKWTQITGHQIGEQRKFLGIPQLPRGSLSVGPMFIDEVMINTNLFGGDAWIDRTYEANSSEYGLFRPFRTGTNSAIYIGMTIPNNSFHANISTAGVGVVLVMEYWNGSNWQSVSNLTDTTDNCTRNGDINFDLGKMSDWTTNNLVVDTYTNEYYWIRARSTNNVTVSPYCQDITRHGGKRLNVYSCPLDDVPVMYVDADGFTHIGGLPLTPATVQTFYYKALYQQPNTFTAEDTNGMINISTKVSDNYNMFTNGAWYPRSTSLVRLNWSIRSSTGINAGRGFYLVLYENGLYSRDLDICVSGNNGTVLLANGTYIFAPSSVTNFYNIGARNFNSDNVILAGGNTNWAFGEKIQ